MHTVSPGDTLWSIANRYNLPLQDIAVTNKLSAPFLLATGQRLRLPPPQTYRVRAGDTLYSVSRLFGVSTSQIARQNHLSAPYTVQIGQVLEMPSMTSKTSEAIGGSTTTPGRKPAYSSGGVVPGHKPTQTAKVNTKPRHKITAKTPARSSSKFMRPVNGTIISSYGPKKNGLHNDGINIRAAKGAPVRAAENGVIVYAGSELKGSGNLVLIRHSGRWMTAYAHMNTITAKRGTVIKRGDLIGTVGSTGSVDSPQLHFEVRRGTQALNPTKYLGG